jgi:hypothetical protein
MWIALSRELYEPEPSRLSLLRELTLGEMVHEVRYQIVSKLCSLPSSNKAQRVCGRCRNAELPGRTFSCEKREKEWRAGRDSIPQLLEKPDPNRSVLQKGVAGPSEDDPISGWHVRRALVPGRQPDAGFHPLACEKVIGHRDERGVALECNDREAASLKRDHLTASAGSCYDQRAATLKVPLQNIRLPREEPRKIVLIIVVHARPAIVQFVRKVQRLAVEEPEPDTDEHRARSLRRGVESEA